MPTDEKGIIQIFNVGAERMLGYSANEVVAMVFLGAVVSQMTYSKQRMLEDLRILEPR